MKLIIIAVAGTILMLAFFLFGLPYLGQGKMDGKAETPVLEYDAGAVSMAAGLVVHSFEIKNGGDKDLAITDIRTSCDCTAAFLTINGEKSPRFSMHNNPSFWSGKIGPGQTGFMEMIFDPAFHGHGGMGEIVRAVYFSTNDPAHKNIELKLSANVVD